MSKSQIIKEFGKLPLMGENVGGIRCHNALNIARTNIAESSLRAVCRPADSVCSHGGLFIATIVRDSGESVDLHLHSTYAVVAVDSEGVETRVGTLSGAFRDSVVVSAGEVAILTDEGVEYVSEGPDGKLVLSTPGYRYVPLRVEVHSETQVGEQIQERSLTGTYNRSTLRLNREDNERFSADLLAAYSHLTADEASRGANLLPVLVRYKYFDRNGRLLFKSMPVLAAASDGAPFCNQYQVDFSSGSLRPQCSVSAISYRMRICSIGGYDSQRDRDVAKLVVETSLPIHPVDYDLPAEAYFDRNRTDHLLRLFYYLPGVSANEVTLRERVAKLLSYGDAAFHVAKTIANPFKDSSDISLDLVAANATTMTAEEHVAATRRLFASSPAPVSRAMASCSMPNSFGARTAARVGDTVIWGNISSRRFIGTRLEQLALTRSYIADTPWQAKAVVTMADGTEKIALSTSGLQYAPTALSPLLAYPAPDAVSLTLHLKYGGKNYQRTFPLSPTADGSMAFYFEPGGYHITLPETDVDFDSEVSVTGVFPHPGTLLSSAVGHSGQLLDSVDAMISRIVAVKSTERRGVSWDYSLRRFYTFSAAGVSLGTLSRDGRFATFHTVDPRPVVSGSAVTETTDDNYPVAYIGGGELIALSRGSLSTILPATAGFDLAGCDVGWDSALRSVTVTSENESLLIGPLKTPAVSRLQSVAVKDASSAQSQAVIPVEYKVEVPSPLRAGSVVPRRLASLVVAMKATYFEGALQLSTPQGCPIFRATFSGSSALPKAFRVYQPPCSSVILTISGRSTADFTLSSLTLLYK